MLKKRTLAQRITIRINKSKTNAFIPSDFFDLSDRDQVGRVLRNLVKKQVLIKLGQGVFARAKKSPVSEKPILSASFPSIAKEALVKLRVKTYPSQAETDYNLGLTTQVPTGLMIAVDSRVSRTLSYNGRTIKYERSLQQRNH